MLNEVLQALKKAREEGNEKEAKRIEKELNKLGMDMFTINMLLESL